MAMIDGPIDYSGNGDLLRRILKSNSSSNGAGIRSNFQSGSSGFQESQGPSRSPPLQSPGGLNIPNVKYREHSANNTTNSHNHCGYSADQYFLSSNQTHSRNPHLVNSVNFQDEEYESSSSTQRYVNVNSAHSYNMPHASNPSNSTRPSEFTNGMLVDISELVDLDSLTPANLCRLSFVDLANLTIVSLVQLQKYGQIINSLQHDVNSLKEELEIQKSEKGFKKTVSGVNSSPKPGMGGGPIVTPQSITNLLEKLPPGKLKDCVECSYKIDDTRRRTSFICKICLMGVHRNSSCWYQHGCWKSPSKENDDDVTVLDGLDEKVNTEMDDSFNGSIDYSSHGNHIFDSNFENSSSPLMSVSNGLKRNTSESADQAAKKVRKTQCKVESMFLHCINRMKEGSRKECSSCSNRKAGKRQRSRYMCSKCGKGLHGRGSCITIHPCWQEEFSGWKQDGDGKEIPETTGSVEVGGVPEITEVDVGGDAIETVDDIKPDRDESLGAIDYTSGQGDIPNNQPFVQGNGDMDDHIHSVPDCIDEEVGGDMPITTLRIPSCKGFQSDMTVEESNAIMRREVHQEFQAEVANVIKALDEV